MQTAEVAIEHVVTGLLTLCAFGLPFARWYGFDGQSLGTGNETLVGILGLAYLFGVVFDKIADTLLSPFEKWLRLCQASELRDRKPGPCKDPFPQDALEFKLREEGGGRVEWLNSLRSRIRTSRGLAVLGLPAALGIALYEQGSLPEPLLGRLFPHLALALNLICIVTSLFLSTPFRIPLTDKPREDGRQRETLFPILRTDELDEKREVREGALRKAKRRMWILACPYMFMQAASVLAVVMTACSQSSRSQSYRCAVIAAAGIGSVLLALWAWYRITDTYMGFVARQLSVDTKDEAATPPAKEVKWICCGASNLSVTEMPVRSPAATNPTIAERRETRRENM